MPLRDAKVRCAKADGNPKTGCRKPPVELVAQLEEHHLPLLVLELHTQHGGCGLDVTVDGEIVGQDA
jgi:hypothetical protein